MQPLLELTQSINWDLAYRNSLAAPVDSQGAAIAPISPVVVTIPSHAAVLIAINNNAAAHWFLAAWVSIRSPRIYLGSTAALNEEVEILRMKLPLRTPTLIRIPNLGIPPYNLYLTFPYWHTTMLLEAWWFNNSRTADPTTEALSEVQSDILRIEGKIDQL